MSCGSITASLVCGYNQPSLSAEDVRICNHNNLAFVLGSGEKVKSAKYPSNIENYWSPEAIACTKAEAKDSRYKGEYFLLVRFSSPHNDPECGAKCHLWNLYNMKGNPVSLVSGQSEYVWYKDFYLENGINSQPSFLAIDDTP